MNFSRKEFIESCLAAGFWFSCPQLFAYQSSIPENEFQDLIKRAGNTNDDKERVLILEKLTYLINWWIDNRQIADGQFGGGWGDDVEMWRSWVPVLFAFDDEKAKKSQEKLFEGLYGLSRMQKGYTTIMNDVEHTSEEYSDPLYCMLNMQPENHTEPTLYYFPTQQQMMYECFLQAYHITRDENFLKPIRFISGMRLKGSGDGDPEDYTTGSLEWSISVLKKIIPGILVKYRLITGDTSYDKIIRDDARDYENFIFTGDVNRLTSEIDEQRKSLSLPEKYYTTEVRWTDRLFASVRYFNFILDQPLPGFNAGFLFSCLTGSVGNYQILPVFGVKWITYPNDIAILTTINSTFRFLAELFHFGNKPRQMKVRFLNLKDGSYKWRLSGREKGIVEISQKNREIEFSLPAQKLCKLTVENLVLK